MSQCSSSDRTASIEADLSEVRTGYTEAMRGLQVQLVACSEQMVRLSVFKTDYKQLSVLVTFPLDYPKQAVNVEIKSRTLGQKLLDGLARRTEAELTATRTGHTQVLAALRFIHNFLEENLLCVANDELVAVRKELLDASQGDRLKLLTKEAAAVLHLRRRAGGAYHLTVRFALAEDYPVSAVSVDIEEHNLPPLFQRYLLGQARETARQCVSKPLPKKKPLPSAKKRGGRHGSAAAVEELAPPPPPPQEDTWQPRPSVLPVATFLVKEFTQLTTAACPCCGAVALPDQPAATVAAASANAPNSVERVYCGHIFHYACLDALLRTPPFKDGKPCPSAGCNARIYHDKWRTSAKVLEQRWAAKQAKQRELQEVVDFLS